MENINDEHLNLIAKHLRGETSAFEENLLKEWLNKGNDNRAIYQELAFIWNAGKTPEDHIPDVAKAWDKVKVKAEIGGQVRFLYNVSTYMKIAAAVVLIIGTAYLMKMTVFNKESITQLSSGNAKQDFYLPDSSRVWLNKNSTMSYSESYNDNDRVVDLDGEAFFEVKKNKEKPFIVNGRLSKTQVLGTSFNVRSLKNETSDKVEVVTGKVSFLSQKSQAKVFLLPGEEAFVNENGKVEKIKIDNPNFLAWQSDKLIFENAPLQKVANAMESYFIVPIEIKNKELLNCRFTGTFDKPQIEEIMKVLSASINLSYNKKDKTYFLTGKGCN